MELNQSNMVSYDSESEQYKRAKKKAREIRSFYFNLLCYCILIPILAGVNLIYTPEYYWVIFSALGWGIGLAFHGMEAFNYNPILGKNWERRKIQQLIEKEKLSETNKTNQ